MGYEETLHGEPLRFISEIENKKTIFQRNNAAIHTVTVTIKWFQNRIVTVASIESWSELDREPVGNSSEETLRPGEATCRKYRWILKGMKCAWVDVQNETSNKLLNSVPDRLTLILPGPVKWAVWKFN